MYNFDDIDDIKVIDKSNMLDILKNFSVQYKEAVEQAKIFHISGISQPIRNIVIAGMGGSAIGGDLLRTLFSNECPIPIVVNRDYDIPKFVNEETLFIAVSYSGNTEETISGLKSAIERKSNIITISNGGEIQRISNEFGLRHYRINKNGLQPRCAFGYMFTPLVFFLSKLGLIQDQTQSFNEVIQLISEADLELSPKIPLKDNLAKQLAHALYGNLPIIYAPQKYLDIVAMRWKGQINENSKTMAFYNIIPEMNHNEIVGWGMPLDIAGKRKIIILTNDGESERIDTRINVTSFLIANTDGQVIRVNARGKSPLAKVLYLIYLGDYMSYYLAILNGIDPTPVERIGLLKSILEKKA